MKLLTVTCAFSVLLFTSARAQPLSKKLQLAYQKFEADSQLTNSISSLYVIDARTGGVVFDKNSTIGLAGASTQKIITAATAYEFLGRDFRYETKLAYRKSPGNTLLITPSGDPTFGSWRWERTTGGEIFKKFVASLTSLHIKLFDTILVDTGGWNSEGIPDGWIWQDIGNYYGAGAQKFNFHENQFDILLKSGHNIGDPVVITGPEPGDFGDLIIKCEVTSAAKGSGDNAYLYLSTSNVTTRCTLRGTIPVDENKFRISVADQDPVYRFPRMLLDTLYQMEKHFGSWNTTNKGAYDINQFTTIYTHLSPTLDSMVYWFLRKSINLYGEAFVKTFACQKNINASTDNGVELVKNYWQDKGIPRTELNMADGSGLSPLNRITTHAQVSILQYAKKQSWFGGFYDALPEYNGMKMKSGTISGVKGFCGYQKSKDGNEYIFSFLVNNYNGSSSSVVQKMYRVLDELK